MQDSFMEYQDKLFPSSGALRETEASIALKIADHGGAIIVWEDAVPIGTAIYYFIDNYMYIGRVSVIPAYRGKGIGKDIILFLEELARQQNYTETRVEGRLSIPQNISFYEKLGYIAIEQIFYSEGTDSWYVMKKTL
jgi:ribosomal protein S18 acetylase RimI-like enzyme